MGKIFTTFLLVITLFFLKTNAVLATDCSDVRIEPSNPTSSTSVTLIATSCQSAFYYVRVTDSTGVDRFFRDQQQPDISGNFSINLGTYVPGEYIIQYNAMVPGIPPFTGNLTVGESSTPVTYKCGDFAPSSASCPANCPYSDVDRINGGPAPGHCSCGYADGTACCEGNYITTLCGPGLTCNTERQCVTPDTGAGRYFCGEIIEPEFQDNFQCVQAGCPAATLDGTTTPPTLWCACGGEGQRCCPLDSGRSACERTDLICETTGVSLGFCGIPKKSEPYICLGSGSLGIDTAIGCLSIPNTNALAASLIKSGVGIVGGLGILLIIYSFIQIILSRGDPERLSAGREILNSALAGIIMVLFSVLLLRFVGINVLGIF